MKTLPNFSTFGTVAITPETYRTRQAQQFPRGALRARLQQKSLGTSTL